MDKKTEIRLIQLEKKVEKMAERLDRDIKDQWCMITTLTKEVKDIEKKK